jgi:hypothetical protein
VEDRRGRARPKLRWMNGIKAVVKRRGANIEYARMCVQDREKWSRVVHSKHMRGSRTSLTFGLVVWRAALPIVGFHL